MYILRKQGQKMLNVKFINWYRTVDFNGLQETLRTLPWDPVTSELPVLIEKFPIILCY